MTRSATVHEFWHATGGTQCPHVGLVKSISARFEVGTRTAADWEQAILTGFDAWRELRDNNGGVVILDARDRALKIEAPGA